MGNNKKSSLKSKRVALKKSLMQSMLTRLKTKAAQYLSPKSLKLPSVTNVNLTACAEPEINNQQVKSAADLLDNSNKPNESESKDHEKCKSTSCPNLQLVEYHQITETTTQSYSSLQKRDPYSCGLEATAKEANSSLSSTKSKPIYPSRIALSRGLDLVATLCFHGLVVVSSAFAGVRLANKPFSNKKDRNENSRLCRLEAKVEAHQEELIKLRELMEQWGKNSTLSTHLIAIPPQPPFHGLLPPPPPPPPPMPDFANNRPLTVLSSLLTPKPIKRKLKENVNSLLRPCISQDDLRRIKLRRTPLTKPLTDANSATPRVTLEALKSVKLKKTTSERIPLMSNGEPSTTLNPLKKLDIVRSPGGTPLKTWSADIFNHDYSGSEGLTPLMTRALQKRMVAWKSASPSNSPTSNDSF